MHVVCSKLVDVVDSETSFANAVKLLTGGDNGKACCVSLTVSRKKNDLTAEEVGNCVSLFTRLSDAGVISDGATATERGEKEGHLHLQSCFWLPAMSRNSSEVQQAWSTLICEHAEFAGTNRHVYAVVHDLSAEPHVTWRTQCGYALIIPALLLLIVQIMCCCYEHRSQPSSIIPTVQVNSNFDFKRSRAGM